MALINLDEVLIDRVGHAARVFGYAVRGGHSLNILEQATVERDSGGVSFVSPPPSSHEPGCESLP